MNAAATIADLRAQGIQLSRNGDRLRVRAKCDVLNADLRAYLLAHKAELLEVLPEDPSVVVRRELEQIAEATGIDPQLVRDLPEGDVSACEGLSTDTQRAYMCALRDSALRQRGEVPPDETARAQCLHCGLVWVAPEVACVAPNTGSIPQVLGCPWCHVRDRWLVPHPPQPVDVRKRQM
jgi:hypothetical protein